MTLASLIKNIKWRFARLFYSENAYKWFQAKERNENFKEGKIVSIDEYTDDKPINKCNKRVVYYVDTGVTVVKNRPPISSEEAITPSVLYPQKTPTGWPTIVATSPP